MKIKILLTILLGCIFYSNAYSQYGGDYEYSREFVWGITKATHSGLIGGLMFKHTRQLNEDLFHGGSLEIVNIKHPQEQKFYRTNNPYIWGKENYLYSIRMSYVREMIVFRKAPQQGVQINAIAMLGPTLGLESPYYVEVARGNGNGTDKVPYDADVHNNSGQVIGGGNFLQGLFESKIVPGLNTKLSLAFEFGTFKSNVVGVETGFQADFFTREVVLIPTADNQSIFPSAFITLFYGSRK